MHFLIGLGILVGLIGFAFGERAAVAAIQIVLVLAGSFAAFVAYMIATRVLQ